jgi:DNA replication and repair protein RecF
VVLSKLFLTNFRSYPDLAWSPDPGINILVGGNGAGKTNLLEAAAYLATLRSVRGAPDDALVADDAGVAIVRGEFATVDRNSLIEVEITRRGGRRALIDRKNLGRASDLLGVMRVVRFLPEDLDLIKGGPSGRRDLLDEMAVQLWPAAHLDQAEYERALRQRNTFLKQGNRDVNTLDVWDIRLAQAAARVMSRRARAASALAVWVEETYSQIAGRFTAVTLGYESDWGGGLDASTPPSEWTHSLMATLERRRRVDFELRTTGAGPHRDDPALWLAERPARHQASQGEQRTLALALRLASHRAIADHVGEAPVLLLDDVYSELDPDRSSSLSAVLPDAQIFITTTRTEEVPVSGKTWRVDPGTVR